jgi:hypothetical protein
MALRGVPPFPAIAGRELVARGPVIVVRPVLFGDRTESMEARRGISVS